MLADYRRMLWVVAAMTAVDLLAVLILLGGSCTDAYAYGPYAADLDAVRDGDTLALRIQAWPEVVIYTDLRLAGVNAPELHPKRPSDIPEDQWAPLKKCEALAALSARDFTRRFVSGKFLEVTEVFPHDTKFSGRMNGSLTADGQDLGAALLESGHAKPYSGETRRPWCEEN